MMLLSSFARSFQLHVSSPATRQVVRGLRSLPPHLEEAKAMLSRGEAVLLDVREPDEWKGGHFARAKLVPYTSQLEKGVVPDDVKQVTKRIFIHCKAGGRASKSCDVLKNQFGLDAVSIPEGFDKLRELGFDDVVV